MKNQAKNQQQKTHSKTDKHMSNKQKNKQRLLRIMTGYNQHASPTLHGKILV